MIHLCLSFLFDDTHRCFPFHVRVFGPIYTETFSTKITLFFTDTRFVYTKMIKMRPKKLKMCVKTHTVNPKIFVSKNFRVGNFRVKKFSDASVSLFKNFIVQKFSGF